MKHQDSCPMYRCTCLCVCGHSLTDHHISCFLNTTEMLVEECEAYGWNDKGGMRYNKKTKEWEDHCHHFKLADTP